MPAAQATSSVAKSKPLSSAQQAKEAKDLQAFLKTYSTELEQLPNGKIRCLRTHTDLPARLTTLKQYWLGPALARAREAISDAELAEQYPTLQPHKTNKAMLFCTLTRVTLNRRRSHVVAHVRGRRWQKEWEKVEERRKAREERERKRKEKAESGKNDDVEARLPEGVLEEEGVDDIEPDDEHDSEAEMDDGEDEQHDNDDEEEAEEDDMPIVRKVAVAVSKKRKGREEDEEEAEEMEEEQKEVTRPAVRGRGKAAQQASFSQSAASQQRGKENKQQPAAHRANGTALNGAAHKRQAVGGVATAPAKQLVNGSKRTGQAGGKKR